MISESDLKRFDRKYDFHVAAFLAKSAVDGSCVTYGELAKQFGGIARGYGDKLGGIALRCRKHDLPMLSVIVVEAQTGLPSGDAELYEYLGLSDEEAIRAEIARCFAFDWSKTIFLRDRQ